MDHGGKHPEHGLLLGIGDLENVGLLLHEALVALVLAAGNGLAEALDYGLLLLVFHGYLSFKFTNDL